MGIVSAYLTKMIEQQRNKGLVVWFDPEGVYREFAETNPEIIRYNKSFFELRYRLNDAMDGDAPPHLVVYVPRAEEDTHYALCEFTAIGIVMKPSHRVLAQNTRLSVIAKAALRDRRSKEQLEEISKKADAGQLSLADLDQIGEDIDLAGSEIIRLIFGTTGADRVAESFILDSAHDAQISERNALPDLRQLLSHEYGCTLDNARSPQETRSQLISHILRTDLIATLETVPTSLASLHIAPDERTRNACVRFAQSWRHKTDQRDAYIEAANELDAQLGLSKITFPLSEESRCETCAILDVALQRAIAQRLAEAPNALTLQAAQVRLDTGFWALQDTEIHLRWTIITCAGRLLLQAEEIESGLKRPDLDVTALLQAYTEGEHPWCELDTLHRKLMFYQQQIDLSEQESEIRRLIALAQRRYSETGSDLATRFMRAFADAHFQVPSYRFQRESYQRYVAPALSEGKTAYLLVDALRFEMGRELAQALQQKYTTSCQPLIATVPTITPVGMAALLSGAQDHELRVVPVGGKLGLQIGGTVLKDRKGRMEWFKRHPTLASDGEPASIYETTLEKLSMMPRDEEALKAADLIVVTSQEIDEIGESDHIGLARSVMDMMLSKLSRAIAVLGQIGCQQVIVTADHGYLFSEELKSGMKIAPPGGYTADLHQRVWVGKGGSEDTAYLRAPLSDFGLSDDLEIAVPWGFGAYTMAGGNRAYFHGGMSPQEIIIPLITVRMTSSPSVRGGEIDWKLETRSTRITTRSFAVTISGQGGLFTSEVPPIRVEIRDGVEVISSLQGISGENSSSLGELQLPYDEAERTIPPTKVILFITAEWAPKWPVTLHLLDATTGKELVPPRPLTWAIAL
jgi:hypothetical protein